MIKPLLILLSLILFSCSGKKKERIVEKEQNNQTFECPIDSTSMQTTEYNGITFYTENNLRGSGVINLSINKKQKSSIWIKLLMVK
ncbi:hypothetical protein [Chryseobacterium sp. JV274]|uniref:hypothetical protein n=1 Tax=Chryseobacterium sp. JV274 TaxID=1932669 RepID=UPI0015C293D0|nr:hypothetical protein [Chryseobacterium sp. JV274]CAD0224714.1 protein of unknown function [Chryseobacterium sp. JV274]